MIALGLGLWFRGLKIRPALSPAWEALPSGHGEQASYESSKQWSEKLIEHNRRGGNDEQMQLEDMNVYLMSLLLRGYPKDSIEKVAFKILEE